MISIYILDDFAIVKIFLTITDSNGSLTKSGNTVDWPEQPNRWRYLATVPVPAGTAVTVQAAAIDGFGGMSTRSERITVKHESW